MNKYGIRNRKEIIFVFIAIIYLALQTVIAVLTGIFILGGIVVVNK